MLTMLFCTAFGSTQQTEFIYALSNTENIKNKIKIIYKKKKKLISVNVKIIPRVFSFNNFFLLCRSNMGVYLRCSYRTMP